MGNEKLGTRPERGLVTMLTSDGHQNGHFDPPQEDWLTTELSSRIAHLGHDNQP